MFHRSAQGVAFFVAGAAAGVLTFAPLPAPVQPSPGTDSPIAGTAWFSLASASPGGLREAVSGADTIQIPGADGRMTTAVRTAMSGDGLGRIWRGTVIAGGEGYLHLSQRGSDIRGSLYLSDRTGVISTRGGVRIQTILPGRLGDETCGPDAPDPIAKRDLSLPAPAPAPGDTPVVDVLVLYPPEAIDSVGGVAAMDAEVRFRIEEANEAFANSLIFRLVHHGVALDIPVATIDVTDVENSATALALRDEYKADLVSFWNVGGIAGQGDNYSGDQSAAFNTSNLEYVQTNYTFIHECGHNLGAKHDRQTLITQGRAAELTDDLYKYGHLFEYDAGTARTVMAYDACDDFGIGGDCTRLPYFSNPAVSYHGVPLGIDPPNAWAANNARRITECAPTVALFRAADPATPLAAGGSSTHPVLRILSRAGGRAVLAIPRDGRYRFMFHTLAGREIARGIVSVRGGRCAVSLPGGGGLSILSLVGEGERWSLKVPGTP